MTENCAEGSGVCLCEWSPLASRLCVFCVYERAKKGRGETVR